jgi:hypothetical protein
MAGLAWFSARLFWKVKYGIPLLGRSKSSTVMQYYYPELADSGLMDSARMKDDQRFDVALLGGSVMLQTALRFKSELQRVLPCPTRTYNLAEVAHTSRDSVLKYAEVCEKDLDLIVLYHGINDARMNCCPKSTFRDDYTHCDWYFTMQRRLEANSLAISDILVDQINYISREGPRREWMEFGADVKSARPFSNNMTAIVRDAQRRGQSVLLMTFGYFLAPDYTMEKFQARQLGYAPGEHRYRLPIELWGEPKHVVAAIETHNRIIRDLASQYDNVIFVDQQKLLSESTSNFADPCHLSTQGIDLFVDNAVQAIRAGLDVDEGGPNCDGLTSVAKRQHAATAAP